MLRQNSRTSRRLGVETLENRLLMVGNVTVSVTGGDLVITGDNLSNEIQIIQAQQNGVVIPGRYFVAGQNLTRINNQLTGQFFNNVTDDMFITLNRGNDRVRLGNGGDNASFVVPDDLQINTGDGDDVVVLDHISVRDDAIISTGSQNDVVSVTGTVGGLAGVDNGRNDMTINTGNNIDNVFVDHFFARRNLTINTGTTDNAVDAVNLSTLNIGGNTLIQTGGGSDTVLISQAGFNDDLTITTGEGTDTVRLAEVEVDALFAEMGGGNNDRLDLRDFFANFARVRGGTGTGDRLDIFDDVTVGQLDEDEFELMIA